MLTSALLLGYNISIQVTWVFICIKFIREDIGYFMAIEVGAKLEGKVTGITHFGAFVDLSGGVTGLVHISEIADNYVRDVNEHLKLNDVVTVKVINVDQNGKIGLSIKQAVDRPPAPPREGRSGGNYNNNRGYQGGGRNSSGNYDGGGHHRDSEGGHFGRSGDGFNRDRDNGSGGYNKPFRNNNGGGNFRGQNKVTFEDKMSRFLKDSEERISTIKKNTEGKRGGRGARRV
jgi:S1 RNA binding domain protein